MTEHPEAHVVGERLASGSGLLLGLAALAVGSAVLYVATYPPWPRGCLPLSVGSRLLTYSCLFALYFAAVCLIWRHREEAMQGAFARLAIGAAVLFRVAVLSGPIPVTGDASRYLWEGRVILAGMNPYAAPPGSPVYDELRRELKARGDRLFEDLPAALSFVRSIYGPVASGLFVLPHWLPFDRLWSTRLLATLSDLGAIGLLAALLRRLNLAPALALIYAWNPVVLSSFADRGQIDGPMTFFLALALYLMVARRPAWSGVAFGAALLVKLAPLWLALPFLRVGRQRFGVALAAVLAVGAIPYVAVGPESLSGYRDFARYWHNTDSLFSVLLICLGPLKGILEPETAARALVLLAAPAYALWRTLRGEPTDGRWLLAACAAIATSGILLSPVVHPWYTAHVVLFVAGVPNPGMLLLSLATMSWFMRFWHPVGGTAAARLVSWLQRYPDPWRWPAYIPVYVLLARSWWRGRRRAP